MIITKKGITCSSLTSTPFFFAERKPRCNIVACAQCIVCRVSGWPFQPQQQQKKLATTDYHHQQHQHLSPNHFVVALPQRHLEHRSPRRSIQLARNQAKRWRHSTKSIFTLLLPHPFQLPGVIMWGLSSYCCVREPFKNVLADFVISVKKRRFFSLAELGGTPPP